VQRVDTDGRGSSEVAATTRDQGGRGASDTITEAVASAIGRHRRRRWPWILLLAVVFAVAAIGLTTRRSSPSEDEAAVGPVNTAEALVVDLVEIDTLDGTLGRVAEDPVSSVLAGVLTYVADAGDVLGNGDVMYRVEGDPVVLLTGTAPPYRDLGLASGSIGVDRSSGTITAAPEVGAVIDQGDVVFEVDGRPVVALYGEVPAYRSMRDLNDNMTGDDVAQLETALEALGYGGFTADDEFTSYTEDAVEDWQEDIETEVDGVVDLGEVVFIPGPSIVIAAADVGTQAAVAQAVVLATEPLDPGPDIAQLEAALLALGYGEGMDVDDEFTLETRSAVLAWQADVGAPTDGIVNLGEVYFSSDELRVSEQLATVGATVGTSTPVLGITAADIVVRVDLPADDQGLLSTGDRVTVVLPSSVEVPATVDSVATVATFTNQGSAVFEVVISLDDPEAAAGLDEAPVDVDVVSDSVADVLAVPVSALVALAEGGYAVEVQQGDGTTVLVAVEPGFYADGLVEVTDTQLQPGMLVVVP